MRATGNSTQWVKMGNVRHIAFVSKDVICYAEGCHAVFIDLHTGEERTFTANVHSVNGDGISVLEGHKLEHVFGYAESCRNSTLYVKTYPSFTTVSTYTAGASEGFIAMAFSETSLFMTLEDLPSFTLTIWNWRSSTKYAELNSEILTGCQILSCSFSKPFTLVQLGVNTDQVMFWELNVCCKQIFVVKNMAKVPKIENLSPFVDALWTTEGGFYILDGSGCIYTIVNEFVLERVVEVSLEGETMPSFAWYKGGLVVGGPDNNLRHYKKSGTWTCDWTMPLVVGVTHLICNRTDNLLGIDNNKDIVKVSNTNGITYLKPNMSSISDFCLVYPVGEFIVALRNRKILNVYHVETGVSISTFNLQGEASTISENPKFPYLAVGYDNGYMELISAYNQEKLAVMASFHLTLKPIQQVKFFEEGKILVAGFLDEGDFFVIEGLPGTQMNVIAHVETKCQIVDYILVASKSCYRLFVIPVTSKYLAGNKIVRYCIVDKNKINVKEYFFDSNDSLYYKLIPTEKLDRDRILFALPFTSRSIHLIEIRRGDSLVRVIEEIKTGHQMRHFDVRITDIHGLTWGFDGFVIARCMNFHKQVGMSLVHHRHQGGVQKAYIDPIGKHIISLGRDEVLVCTNLVDNDVDENLKESLVEIKESTKYALMFKRQTIGFKPEGRFRDKTWVEVNTILKIQEEELVCREKKNEILSEFHAIKTSLNNLVTENLEGPENEKIDLLEFYLDTRLYKERKQKNREDCKQQEIYLKALIEAQDKVSQYILKNYLEPMEVRDRMIRGMFQNVIATNYTLLPVDQLKKRRLIWVQEQRKVEIFLSAEDIFEPWVIIPKNVLTSKLAEPSTIISKDYGGISALLDESPLSRLSVESQIAYDGSVAQLYIERNPEHYKQRQIVSFYQCDLQQTITETHVKIGRNTEKSVGTATLITKDYGGISALLDESPLSRLSVESQIAYDGSVAQLYIERNPEHYKQRQIVSFYQCDLQQTITEFEVLRLKLAHNEQFNKLVEMKYREMDVVTEKHNRLRHIVSEFNHFSKNKISVNIVDPIWTQEEEPWLIATVKDEELPITPYISPSEQAVLDAAAEEEERIRLALLADDFKERALMAMMNGVLEIRWEDELKKEVPLPKCMLDKDHGVFNEEDLRAIRDYEEKVVFLNSERERYKNILDTEFTKTSIAVRDTIRKFNQKVKDTMNIKMYIDSGMNQENLIVNRARLNQNERIKLYRKEEGLEVSIRRNDIAIQQLHETVSKANEALSECKTALETFQIKEKLLDKAFRRDIQEASPVVQEQAMKLYKKRPRAAFRQMNTVAGMFELAKCIVTQEDTDLLNQEAVDYIKAVDHLDQFVGLPPTIDEHIYSLICRHRRLRLEYEIKLKAIQMQLMFGEATVSAFQKRASLKKENNAKLLMEKQKIRSDYLYLNHNIQIQIVLRRGLVEIPLSGDIKDFADAILVPKVEIENINREIKQAGEKKLQTMMRNMAFRRKIMETEWVHKKYRLQINDLIEQIRDINSVKFTREMQVYAKGKSLGHKTEMDSFEQDVEVISAAFESNIRYRKEKLRKIRNQIQSYKDHNEALDKTIKEKNVDVCHLQLQKDLELDCRENTVLKSRMDALLRRSALVQAIQRNHNEILVLQTELELLRLRTYPTFKYKLINSSE